MLKNIINSDNPNIKLPYILIIPEEYDKDSSLIVDIKTPMVRKGNIEEIIDEEIKDNMNGMGYMAHAMMERLKCPVLVPIIPRIPGFYSSYLGSSVIKNDFSKVNEVTGDYEYYLTDLDKQVALMIEEVNSKLELTRGATMLGYSASSKFTSGFAVLHPDIMETIICGGTSGLSTLPTEYVEDIYLPYPLGVGGIDFDFEVYSSIKHLYYIAKEDNNNPALPKCELSGDKDANGNPLPSLTEDGRIKYRYDEDGMLLPFYEDCYTKEEINIIDKLYGHDNLPRFRKNQMIMESLVETSKHIECDGNHKTIFSINREYLIDEMISIIERDKNVKKSIC